MSLEEIFEKVQKDPETKVNVQWVEKWLETIVDKDETYHYLENKTTHSIHEDKEEILREFVEKDKWMNSLSMYRIINDLQDLRLGHHIRWIREKEDGTYLLTNGGILVQTKFLKNGVYVVCKNGYKIMQYQLEKCITFQKISAEEWIVLMAKG
jgi:hypothetical protein